MNRCLLLGCTKTKRSDSRLLPAIERYDGLNFRVLRRFLRDNPNEQQNLVVLVLSARLGLLSGDEMIPGYDRRMSRIRAVELRPQVLDSLSRRLCGGNFSELFIVLGKDYLAAIQGLEAIVPKEVQITQVKGPQGMKARQLKWWLYGKSLDIVAGQAKALSRPSQPRGYAIIGGHRFVFPTAQVIEQARKALRDGFGIPDNFRGWYIMIDDRKVGPKWLASLLTGLPVSSFTASEARRFLSHLGIPSVRA